MLALGATDHATSQTIGGPHRVQSARSDLSIPRVTSRTVVRPADASPMSIRVGCEPADAPADAPPRAVSHLSPRVPPALAPLADARRVARRVALARRAGGVAARDAAAAAPPQQAAACGGCSSWGRTSTARRGP